MTDSIKTLINDLQIFSRIALFGRSYLTRRNEEFVKVFVTLFQSIAYFFQKPLLLLHLLPLVLHLQQSKCRIKFVTSNGKSEAYRNEEKGSKLKKGGRREGRNGRGVGDFGRRKIINWNRFKWRGKMTVDNDCLVQRQMMGIFLAKFYPFSVLILTWNNL